MYVKKNDTLQSLQEKWPLNFLDMPPVFHYLKPFYSLDMGGILSTVHHTLFISIEHIFQGYQNL